MTLAGQPSGVAFTPEGVWVSYAPAGVARVDPADLSVTLTQTWATDRRRCSPRSSSIWVANHLDNTVSRLEPSTGTRGGDDRGRRGSDRARVPRGTPCGSRTSSTARSRRSTRRPTRQQPVPVGGAAASLAADGGDDLWLAVGASATEHRGGTLTVSSGDTMRHAGSHSLDPAVVVYNDRFGGQILSITNDGLLSFKKVGGPDGATLVPDLASALPEVSDDGLTYRFPLREGIRYSNGDPVRPEDFRHAVERAIALNAATTDVAAAVRRDRRREGLPEGPVHLRSVGLHRRRRRGRDVPSRAPGPRSAIQARDAVGLPGPGRDPGRGPGAGPPAGDGTVHDRGGRH